MFDQKCKIKWLNEGDERASFFHGWASAMKNRACLSILEIEDERFLSTKTRIEENILGFYRKLHADDRGPQFTIEGIDWALIDSQITSRLERPFS